MNPYNFAVLFFGFCAIFIGVLVWLRRLDEIGKRYCIFSVCSGLWGIGFAIEIGGATSYEIALLSVRLGVLPRSLFLLPGFILILCLQITFVATENF